MRIGKIAIVIWKTRPRMCFGNIIIDFFAKLQQRKQHIIKVTSSLPSVTFLPSSSFRSFSTFVTMKLVVSIYSSSLPPPPPLRHHDYHHTSPSPSSWLSSPSSSSWLLYNHQLIRKSKSPPSAAPLLRLRPRDFPPTRRLLRQRRPEKQKERGENIKISRKRTRSPPGFLLLSLESGCQCCSTCLVVSLNLEHWAQHL